MAITVSTDSVPRLLATLACLLATPHATASLWSSTFEGRGQEQGRALAELASGEVAIAGSTGRSTEKTHAWLLRLAADGQLLTEIAYVADGLAAVGGVDGAAVTADGGAIFTGREVFDIFTVHHAWVARLDVNGAIVWGTRLYTPPEGAFGRWFLFAAAETADGGVIACGSTAVTDAGPASAWLVRFDATGQVLWQHQFGGGPQDARSVVPTADGGFVVAGRSAAGAGLGDGWVMKVDAVGDLVWQQTLGGADQDELTDIVALTEGFAVVGSTNSFTASGHAGWAMRLDDDGLVVWNAVFGDGEWSDLSGVSATSSDGLLLAGRVSGPVTNDLWLLEVAVADGAVRWQRAYEGASGDQGTVARERALGGILALGTWAWGFGDDERVWGMRLDPDGTIPGCPLERATSLVPSAPRLTVAAGPVTQDPPAATFTQQAFTPATALDSAELHCGSTTCDDQGNVLLGARQGNDVFWQFPMAPMNLYRMHRDDAKLRIGMTSLGPDFAPASFRDVAAVPAVPDFYYYLRGVCNGEPGP